MKKQAIVCGVDSSRAAKLAIAEALRFAEWLQAEVHWVHVYGLPSTPMPFEGAALATAEQAVLLSKEAEAAFARVLSELAVKTGVRHLVVGDAAQEIVRIASETAARYIIVGTHGRRGLSHFLAGSVAEDIIAHATVPVLVVHAED